MKTLWKTTLIIALALGATYTLNSCKTEGCTDATATNYDPDAEKDDDSCVYDEEEDTDSELPATYIVFDGDTFYYTANSVNPDPNAYRYQVNFGTKEQLDQTANDGNTATTLSLTLTFKDKPTASGTSPFSRSRFQDVGSDSLNFYISVFFNTGHTYEGENFLSPSSGSMAYTIEGTKFNATVPEMDVILESNQTQTVKLNGGNLELDW